MISLKKLKRHYTNGERTVHAVDGISLEIARHEFVAIRGPSGCGKSTLLHLLAGLDTPSSGELFVDGLALHNADDVALTDYRRRRLGIVFQFFNLLPTLNALENVTLPLLLQGAEFTQSIACAREMLALVRLTSRENHFVHQLSGGEQQRVAIARALVHQPSLLIADEPTGNLDSESSATVMRILEEIAGKNLTTLIVVTHAEEVAHAASRRVEMRDGAIVSDRK